MFKSIVVFIAMLAICTGELVHPKLSAGVKNTAISGIEGLNLHLTVPYKFQDYLVGVKHTLNSDLRRLPDSLFVKKSFDTPLDGSVALDASVSIGDKTIHLDSEWSSKKHGVTALVRADSQDFLKKVKLTKEQSLPNGLKGSVTGAYCVGKNTFCGTASVSNGATSVTVAGDSDAQDPVLTVSHKIDENNEVAPSVHVRTGAMNVGFTRRWVGGSAKANLVLNDKVSVEWKDQGASGVWTTTADFPLNGDKPRVTFARDWVF